MPGFGFASIDDPLHYKVLKSCKFKIHKWIFHITVGPVMGRGSLSSLMHLFSSPVCILLVTTLYFVGDVTFFFLK